MSHVFVLDTNKQPLNPVHPGYARRLLKQGRAAVFRRFPFTIILKSAVAAPRVEALRIKLDRGLRTTGIAILSDQTGAVVFAAELSHRAHTINASSATVTSRAQDPLQKAPVRQSEEQANRLVTTFAAIADQQRLDLGRPLVWMVSHHRHQPRTGQVRHAADGVPRNQRSRVPAGNACRLRGSRVPA